MENILKICSRCNINKLLDQYHKHKGGKHGRNSICKGCLLRQRNGLNHVISVVEKQCKICLLIKASNKFKSNRRIKDGLHSYCRRCELDKRYLWQKTVPGKKFRKSRAYTILRYTQAKSHAKRKGLDWNLEKEYYNSIKDSPCHYCGFSIITCGVGLDRIDSALGYVKENIVPCCDICNTMKWDYWSYDEMVKIGSLVRDLRLIKDLSLLNKNMEPLSRMAMGV